MTRDEKVKQLNKDLINLMMEKYGITYDDILSHVDSDKRWVIDGQDWFVHYTLTKTEEEEFRKKAVDLIKKRLGVSKAYAENEFSWWNLSIGLRVIDEQEQTEENK